TPSVTCCFGTHCTRRFETFAELAFFEFHRFLYQTSAMETGNLRNEDFRKLLTQKRSEPAAKATGSTDKSKEKSAAFSHKQAAKQQYKKKGGAGHKHKKDKKKAEKEEKAEQEEEDEDEEEKLKEILKNYRDRAAERRNKGDEPEMDPQLAAAYRAVPGDRRAVFDAAMKRQQAIEESKYLGGDMEHTHLVKGLDYSLLHKVRAEITKTRQDEPIDEDEELEAALTTRKVERIDEKRGDEKQAESVLARNVQRILFKNEPPLRNELFGKGRMAYVVELDDEMSDVPTTLLRSLHDCPATESNATVNANTLLITKLTQVLSYLRTDTKKGKGRQPKDDFVTEADRSKAAGASIFDDAGEYVPKREKEIKKEVVEGGGGKDGKRDYFGDGAKRDDRDRRDDRRRDDRGRGDGERDRRRDERDREDRERERRRADERDREELRKRFDEQKRLDEKLAKRKRDTEGYDECYPGGLEMGGFNDSDDEEEEGGPASKKGRSAWGDDDKEKFSKTSRNTEVKAAYQFGVKKGDGRKSGKQQDKRLDQELDKINKIMEKRKTEGTEAPKVRY
ncbi:hypothetical protein PFISCL1PPCAC_9860, partial [Pristionchus fissidentatus]